MGGVLAGVLAARGNSAIVFHGGGLDELTTTGPSAVWVVADGVVTEAEFDPASLGVPRASVADLRGADATHNSAVVRSVLAGEPGPVRDIVLLNAAAALAAAEGLSSVTLASSATAASAVPAASAVQAPSAPADAFGKALTDGLSRATEAIDSGAAQRLLARWSETSHRLATPRPRLFPPQASASPMEKVASRSWRE
jgi:anthranilate phosphoribosyltransferase